MVDIHVNGPMYRGAPQPKFKAKMVNEQQFGHDLRCKEARITFDKANNKGEVSWLSQDADYSSEDFDKEIARAFKANGAPVGMSIEIDFGCRDTGINQHYSINIK